LGKKDGPERSGKKIAINLALVIVSGWLKLKKRAGIKQE